ncbi:MAG: outer membrane lipoprotein chaperone LolA [Pseudomonadota bacterium]
MMRSVRYLVGLLCFVGAQAADAASESRLERFVTEVQTLSAHFEQTQYDDHGEVTARRSGDFQLARPGRFRWHYAKPYEQLMVCDGDDIWNYEPDLAQVTVRDAEQILRDTPAALLARGSDLEARFTITPAGSDGDAQLLKLEPKTADTDFGLIELWLRDSGVPERMRLHDPLGGTSDIRFSEVVLNAPITAQRFRFEPPAGVEVVRLE